MAKARAQCCVPVILCLVTACQASALVPLQDRARAKELFFDPSKRTFESAGWPTQLGSSFGSDAQGQQSPKANHLAPLGRRPSNPPPASSQRPLGLSYWIELESADGANTRVTANRTFQSGERIRLHFRSNAPGQIALIQLGASGSATMLFPDPIHELTDDALVANQDRVLPGPSHWFRFDDQPGTERILVLFGTDLNLLRRSTTPPGLGSPATKTLVENAQRLLRSKDLLIETEETLPSEIGTYGVNLSGSPVVLEIQLQHR